MRTSRQETLEPIKRSVHIPVCAIGGINEKTLPDFKGSAIDGFAIVSAIAASEEPKGGCGKTETDDRADAWGRMREMIY